MDRSPEPWAIVLLVLVLLAALALALDASAAHNTDDRSSGLIAGQLEPGESGVSRHAGEGPATAKQGRASLGSAQPGEQADREAKRAPVTGRAGGRPAPFLTVLQRRALHLARMCELECTSAKPWCFNDMPAIYGVGQRRFGDGWLRGLQRYTQLYARDNARAQRIAKLPWGDAPWLSKRRNRLWRDFREHALATIAGLVKDPCPGAIHWGSPRWDVIPPSLVRVKCTERTGNLFLRRR